MTEMTENQLRLKEEFTRERGYWSSFWDDLLVLDEDFLEKYIAFSSAPWRNGVLEPKVKELVYLAIDASTTHLYEPGLRIHIRNAIKHGATQREILEVLQLVSAIGIHSCTLGVPVMMEEFRALEER